jgi:prophage antirepressor-like protein
MNELQIFNNTEFGKVTTVVIDGKVHFAATECAGVLGYTNPEKAIRDHCKGGCVSFTIKKPVISHGKDTGKTRDVSVNFISEGDLMRLIVRSNLPEAEQFERWVFDEVLPSIRKHGAYMTADFIDRVIADPDIIIRCAMELKAERDATDRQHQTSMTSSDAFDTGRIENEVSAGLAN